MSFELSKNIKDAYNLNSGIKLTNSELIKKLNLLDFAKVFNNTIALKNSILIVSDE